MSKIFKCIVTIINIPLSARMYKDLFSDTKQAYKMYIHKLQQKILLYNGFCVYSVYI